MTIAYVKKVPIYVEKVCLNCGKPFTSKYSYQKYCSHECLLQQNRINTNASHKREEKVEYVPKQPRQIREASCLWCQSLYKTFYPTSLFCFHECRYQYGKMEKRIVNQFTFDREGRELELSLLKLLGSKYSLPARDA